MILKQLISDLDKVFNKGLALEWDRVGLQVGKSNKQVRKILVTLDVDDELIEEATSKNTDLIISHHPVIFDDLASITDSTPAGKRVLRLIENDIAAYSAHTNYDIMEDGLNDIIAGKLGLDDIKPMGMCKRNWYKFVIFVPVGSQDDVRKAICSSGGGKLGDYSCCTFSTRGKGTFLPGENAQPYTGKTGELNTVDEVRLECIVEEKYLDSLVTETIAVHPYEEPAYDIFRMENRIGQLGPGRAGRLQEPVPFNEYIRVIRRNLDAGDIGFLHRGMENTGNRIIEKVCIVAGSCNSLTEELAAVECDLILTGEISYHNGISLSESGKIVAKIGHGTIEKHAISGIHHILDVYKDKNKQDIEIMDSKKGYWDWRFDIGRK